MIDILWTNNFSDNGYGRCGRRYVQVLSAMGYKVRINVQAYMRESDPLFKLRDTKIEDHVHVFHGIPTIPQKAYYTVTEVKKPPDYMSYNLKNADFIMTQSSFCKESFSRVTDPEKIHVVYFPFFKHQNSPKGVRFNFNMDKEYKFKFFTVARVDVRKNLTTLMKAFSEEFGDDPDVCLIMKMGSDRYCIPKMFYDMDLPKNIYWMSQYVNDMSALYRSADAYITTDNGEGWGAPTTEAMLCGLPTIAPNHSGHLDYMNKDNSYLIDVGDWEFIGNDKDHPERLKNLYQSLLCPYLEWKRPKFEDVKKKMRQCYEDYKDVPKEERIHTDKVKNALKVQELVSAKNIAEQLKSALDWYENTHA